MRGVRGGTGPLLNPRCGGDVTDARHEGGADLADVRHCKKTLPARRCARQMRATLFNAGPAQAFALCRLEGKPRQGVREGRARHAGGGPSSPTPAGSPSQWPESLAANETHRRAVACSRLGLIAACLGPILRPVGPELGPSWARVGPVLGPCWASVWLVLGVGGRCWRPVLGAGVGSRCWEPVLDLASALLLRGLSLIRAKLAWVSLVPVSGSSNSPRCGPRLGLSCICRAGTVRPIHGHSNHYKGEFP